MFADIHPQRRNAVWTGKRETGVLDLKNLVFKGEVSGRVKFLIRRPIAGLERNIRVGHRDDAFRFPSTPGYRERSDECKQFPPIFHNQASIQVECGNGHSVLAMGLSSGWIAPR